MCEDIIKMRIDVPILVFIKLFSSAGDEHE